MFRVRVYGVGFWYSKTVKASDEVVDDVLPPGHRFYDIRELKYTGNLRYPFNALRIYIHSLGEG
jgi:hypothetical protein